MMVAVLRWTVPDDAFWSARDDLRVCFEKFSLSFWPLIESMRALGEVARTTASALRAFMAADSEQKEQH